MSMAALDALTDVVLAYHPPKRIKPRKKRRPAPAKAKVVTTREILK